MGILIDPPDEHLLGPAINWDSSVIGMFIGPNPPLLSVVQNILDTHWVKRGPIRVRKIWQYFAFLCSSNGDAEALLQVHTTVMDGRIITFRPGFRDLVLSNLNFNRIKLWVRVHGMPLSHLDVEWGVKALRHVGIAVRIDGGYQEVPGEPDIRVQLLIDVSKPLIPGCFLPLSSDCVMWVYFRYEGVFKFCKKCGSIGHYTCNCSMTDYDASRFIGSYFDSLEARGLTIMHGAVNQPFHTNLIEGLTDRFCNRNTRLNLLFYDWVDNPQPGDNGNDGG